MLENLNYGGVCQLTLFRSFWSQILYFPIFPGHSPTFYPQKSAFYASIWQFFGRFFGSPRTKISIFDPKSLFFQWYARYGWGSPHLATISGIFLLRWVGRSLESYQCSQKIMHKIKKRQATFPSTAVHRLISILQSLQDTMEVSMWQLFYLWTSTNRAQEHRTITSSLLNAWTRPC